jgi:hypothetical protein
MTGHHSHPIRPGYLFALHPLGGDNWGRRLAWSVLGLVSHRYPNFAIPIPGKSSISGTVLLPHSRIRQALLASL